jgi:hypothetical protein
MVLGLDGVEEFELRELLHSQVEHIQQQIKQAIEAGCGAERLRLIDLKAVYEQMLARLNAPSTARQLLDKLSKLPPEDLDKPLYICGELDRMFPVWNVRGSAEALREGCVELDAGREVRKDKRPEFKKA